MANSKFECLSSAYATSCYCADDELRLVVVGKTGSGKSSLGNSILAQEKFPSDSTGGSITKSCRVGYRQWKNRKLVVVDTPGMFDTIMSHNEVIKEVGKSIALSCPGPHAVLLVVNGSTRFTEEECQTIKLLKVTFGDGVVDYMVVVFTREDQMLKKGLTMDKWLEKAPPELIQTLGECGYRFLTINNDADPDTLETKLVELNQIIQNLLQHNNGDIYTNELYEMAKIVLKEKEESAQRVEEERIRFEEHAANANISIEAQRERIKRAREEARNQERDNAQNEKGDTWTTMFQKLAPIIIALLAKTFFSFFRGSK